MSDLVTVDVVAEHDNGYGDKRKKAAGDAYECPRGTALQLEASKLATIRKAAKAPPKA